MYSEMLTELVRREKEAKIKPDPDIDMYMKVKKKNSNKYHSSCRNKKECLKNLLAQASSLGGQKENLVTDYILKVVIYESPILQEKG